MCASCKRRLAGCWEGVREKLLRLFLFEYMWPSYGHRPACDNRIMTHHTEKGQSG